MDAPGRPPPAQSVAAAHTAPLREGLAALQRDVAASIRLCSRDFGVLGRELLVALARRSRRERALELARDHERETHERLAARLVEMQGNLRVLCRVRPLLPLEKEQAPGRDPRAVTAASAQEVLVRSSGAVKSFSFLRVLDEIDGPRRVFQEVAPLVRAAADGHRACVFVYGQTGAGKTHTLQGGHHQAQLSAQAPAQGEDDQDDAGVYESAARLLFESLAARTELFRFSVAVQMVEVYNEEIYDLLGSTPASQPSSTVTDAAGSPVRAAPTPPADPFGAGIHVGATSMFGPPPASATSSPPVGELRHGEDGVVLKNVASVRVQSPRDVTDAIARGSSSRLTAGDRAVRSHCVVLVHITRTSKEDGAESIGRLVFVDLAGSERLAKASSSSTAVALALREAQHVNKSLAAVGDVLAAVAAREKHVPFRNSKLTHLLQDSLSGGARSHALLLVHVSPARADASETVNSLKFAARVCRPPQVIAGRHRAMRGELQQQRTEVSRLNQVIMTQAAQIKELQDKLAAEVELRKKCEKRLEEEAAVKKRLQLALAAGRRASTSPPDGRRWSLYARKEAAFSALAPPNGIENVAANIMRSQGSDRADGEERSRPEDVKPADENPAASLATPMRLGRRHSPASNGSNKRGRSKSPSPASARRVSTAVGSRSPVRQLRSILKKRRGNNGRPIAAKQVSFDMVLQAQSPPAIPSKPALRQAIEPLRIPAPTRRLSTGASRVLTSTVAQSSPAKRVAATTPLRRKPKWNAGWR